MASESQHTWQIIARAHNEEWQLYDSREHAGVEQKSDLGLTPDGHVAPVAMDGGHANEKE